LKPVTDPLIASLFQAVKQNPQDVPLRLHLAGLLLQKGSAQEALQHCAHVLATRPDDTEALLLGSQAARRAGKEPLAQAYEKLHAALAVQAPAQERPAPPPLAAPPPAPAPPPMHESGFEDVPLVFDDSPAAGAVDDDEEEDEPAPERAEGPGREQLNQLCETELPRITLRDVAGMEPVKRRLELSFLSPLRNPEVQRLFKKTMRGGLLLYGPPGCGKTYIARATAGELGANFIAVGIADILDVWVGSSERNLHEIFAHARRHAPCVIFFDELDAVGHKRSQMRHSTAQRNVVNQFLFETDSVNYNNDGIYLMGATNHPWDVDSALKRPGRFDRTLLVLPPDAPARRRIAESAMDGIHTEAIRWERALEGADGYSCADIVHLCQTATDYAAEEYILSGRMRGVSEADFKRARAEVRPSTLAWFETARNFAMFANEGGAYDELVDYLRARKML
jgi:SpoVK/Ycf46/Vps4 family AAA+-type ATPase